MAITNNKVIRFSQELLIGENVTEERIKEIIETVCKVCDWDCDRELCVKELKRRNNVH